MEKLKKILGEEAYNNLLNLIGQEELEKIASKFDNDDVLLNSDGEYVKKSDVPKPEAILGDGWLKDNVVNYEAISDESLRNYIKGLNSSIEGKDTELANVTADSKAKLINLALRNGAKHYNMHDVEDIFKNVDTSSIKFGEDGLPAGVDDIFTNLKANKGYLFKTDDTNAGAGLNPPSDPVSNLNQFSSWTDILNSCE